MVAVKVKVHWYRTLLAHLEKWIHYSDANKEKREKKMQTDCLLDELKGGWWQWWPFQLKKIAPAL